MERQQVLVGSVVTSGGLTRDTTRAVAFVAEELATYAEAGDNREGKPMDTRGHSRACTRAGLRSLGTRPAPSFYTRMARLTSIEFVTPYVKSLDR